MLKKYQRGSVIFSWEKPWGSMWQNREREKKSGFAEE